MRRQATKLVLGFVRPPRLQLGSSRIRRQPAISAIRTISIQATPASVSPSFDPTEPQIAYLDPSSDSQASAAERPDARFEVLGATSSLLSVALSASQNLYTRRGTLVGVAGSPENAVSSLSALSPLIRAPVGIPFLYQKISSTTPLNLLVATKAPHTTFSVLHLDGRVDWTVTQRTGLVAWTGHTMSVKPTVNMKMSLAHWGNSVVTGRGLVALAASGTTYSISLNAGEHYVAHPSNVLAYALNSYPPQPYRFKSSNLRFQLPTLNRVFPNNKFFQTLRTTKTYKFLAEVIHVVRTWTRRTIWGDRLFLRFQGPTTILFQSRGSRIRDVLSSQDANEIAEAPAGILQPQPTTTVRKALSGQPEQSVEVSQHARSTKMSYASVGGSGNVSWSPSR